MNGGNLFSVLISTIKSRFAAIMSKIKLWTSWNFIRSQVVIRIRQFLTKLFDVKPKDQKDYYTIFGWMVSKKLAYSIVIFLGIISIWYIFTVRNVFSSLDDAAGIRTYKYNSVQLRMAKDMVRIKGKSGYIAYEGNVSKGYVTGQGTLYAPAGNVVYRGNFQKNKFEGEGKSFFPNGIMQYEGSFHENLFDGEGTLYRDNGSLLYTGSFSRGMKNGEGKLCAENGKVVFEGLFSNDDLVYAAFVDKTAAEAGDMYSGLRRVWQSDNSYCVYMSDIDAMYYGKLESGTLDNEVKLSGIYVNSDSFPLGTEHTDSLTAISGAFGSPLYEGNSDALFAEAVLVNILNETRPAFAGPVNMNESAPYSDVTVVGSYADDYPLYLTAYRVGNLIYTFYSEDKNDKFKFYSISSAEEG